MGQILHGNARTTEAIRRAMRHNQNSLKVVAVLHDFQASDIEGDEPKKRFKFYLMGYFPIDLAEVQTDQGRLYLYLLPTFPTKFAGLSGPVPWQGGWGI